MTIQELLQSGYFELRTECVPERTLEHVQICDLMSWVMRIGKERDAWITVQTHLNVVAVASLLDFSCVIIPSSIEIPQETLDKANRHNVCILSTNLSPFQICKLMLELGIDHETLL